MPAAARLLPLLPLVPALVVLLAHLPRARGAWDGRRWLGEPVWLSDGLATQRIAHDAWQHVAEAGSRVDGVGDAARFVARDVWQAAIDSGALNVLDLAVLVWPLRLALGVGPALVVLHLLLLLLAALAGERFAAALGADPVGRAASSAVAVGAGVVGAAIGLGQYPQALIAAPLVVFVGFERLWQGRRDGIAWLAGAAAASALLYWQWPLLWGLGALVWLAGARAAGPPAPTFVRDVVVAAIIAAIVVLPAAWPVIEVWRAGAMPKLGAPSWGEPFPAPGTPMWQRAPYAALALKDAAEPRLLLHPGSGLLVPALPLVPLVLAALRERRAWRWVALVLLGAALCVGPLPEVPFGAPLPGPDATPRVDNPLYQAAYRWVPTFARQHHAIRWASLTTVGLCALAAIGAGAFAARPRLASALAVGGAAWIVVAGPLPLPTARFPGELEAALRSCDGFWLATAPRPTSSARARVADVLPGVAWQPAMPARAAAATAWGRPTPTTLERSRRLEREVAALLAGRGADLGGACVVVDEADASARPIAAALRRHVGEPDRTVRFAPGELFPRVDDVVISVWAPRR